MFEDLNRQKKKRKETHNNTFTSPFSGHKICKEAQICYQVNYLCFRVAEAFTFPD